LIVFALVADIYVLMDTSLLPMGARLPYRVFGEVDYSVEETPQQGDTDISPVDVKERTAAAAAAEPQLVFTVQALSFRGFDKQWEFTDIATDSQLIDISAVNTANPSLNIRITTDATDSTDCVLLAQAAQDAAVCPLHTIVRVDAVQNGLLVLVETVAQRFGLEAQDVPPERSFAFCIVSIEQSGEQSQVANGATAERADACGDWGEGDLADVRIVSELNTAGSVDEFIEIAEIENLRALLATANYPQAISE